MANKISGIDGRPVQVGGGAPVSRARDATRRPQGRDHRYRLEHRRLRYRAHPRRPRKPHRHAAGGEREPRRRRAPRAWTKAAITSIRSASPTRCCASKSTCSPPSPRTSNSGATNVDAALTRDTLGAPARRGKRRARRIRSPARPGTRRAAQARHRRARSAGRRAPGQRHRNCSRSKTSAAACAACSATTPISPASPSCIAWCDPPARWPSATKNARRAPATAATSTIAMACWSARRSSASKACSAPSPAPRAEPRAYGPRGQSNPYAAAAGKVLSAEA